MQPADSLSPARPEPASPVVTPQLRRLLGVVLALFGLLAVNSLYLAGLTLVEQVSGETYQNYFYLTMFLAHLGLGLLLILPVLMFGLLHMRRAWIWRRYNRYAVGAGLALYATAILVLVTGVLLTRFGFFEIDDPTARRLFYWLHVLAPLLVVWLFVLHRLAGPRIAWRRGLYWAGAAVALSAVAVGLHLWVTPASVELASPWEPALLRTDPAQRIAPAHLAGDDACGECHADILQQASAGMHRFSSFNNPAYRFSVQETRDFLQARDGNVDGSRLCAGCHDVVPLLAGTFARADYDPDADPFAQAGITCLVCHAITAVNSPRGNADYTLVDPPRYPFAFSDNGLLRAVNRQLIKAKPEFHKKTLLKPVHKSAAFCSVCHKVHLPYALNHYRWLRGQNHYDSFLLSGVSGHRVDSFYYPPKAVERCAQCHMPVVPADDPAARDFAGTGRRGVHDHGFAAANTAVPVMLDRPASENAARVERMSKAARVDIFGIRDGGAVDGELRAPLRPALPMLERGRSYLIETVVRTVGIGHQLTQGTADSNELWLDVTVRDGDRVIGRSGALDERGDVDAWAYYLNAYVLDRDGNRIERRNAQDIFVALYDHQIPPGAAAVAHYALKVPADVTGPVTVEAKLQYRKFDTRFYSHVLGDRFTRNDLPIATLASDTLTLPLNDAVTVVAQTSAIPVWERWNDYGIALLREGDQGANKGELRAATAAFEQVEALGRPDGALNLARVHFKEGDLDAAAAALGRAARFDPPAPPWTLAWFSALVDHQRGDLDPAIDKLEALAATRFQAARERGFDFGADYGMLNELGRALFDRARQERGEARRTARMDWLHRARDRFEQVLAADPENVTAHYNLALVCAELGEPEQARLHRAQHERYRPDDQAIQRAVTIHRERNAAADHAAEAVAIYDLQRESTTAGEAFAAVHP